METPINKTLYLGMLDHHSLFAHVTYTNDGILSIMGVHGPYKSGNAWGGCGQIILEFKEYDARGYYAITDIIPAKNWNHDMLKKFFDVWDKWHLNDRRAGCEHQRALGWTYEDHKGVWEEKIKELPHDLIDEYATGESEEMIVQWNAYEGHNCPVCGYSIGSAWLFEAVPQDVIEFLQSLPQPLKIPAWI